MVRDERGAPVAGAEVVLRTAAASTLLARTRTDESGQFVLDSQAAGDATIEVEAHGFARYERRLAGAGVRRVDETERIEIVLAPAALAEAVTVTATRTETRIGETAQSVRVLSGAELQTSAALTLDDALRQVPGFQLFRRASSRTANPTTQGVSLRGVGASGASRALVLADGVPLNDPFGGWVYWGRVPRESVSRVEVLRGAASSLYGSAALGGVVQIITRPIEERPQLSLEAAYGSERTPEASLFASGRRGAWGASLAAEAFRTDGFVTVAREERGPVDTPAGSRRTSLTLTLERLLSKQARLFARGSLFAEDRRNGTPLQTNRTHLRQIVTGLDWQEPRAGAFTLRAYGGTQVYNQTFSAISADRRSETLTRLQRVPAQHAGLTVQWSRSFGTRHALVAGLEAREVRGTSDETVFVAAQAGTLFGAGGRERSTGLFVQDLIRLTPRLLLTLGLRHDAWRNFDARQDTRSLRGSQLTTVQQFRDRSETATSPHASLLFKASRRITLAASMTRAFRAPTLNELYRSFRVGDVLTLANENLRAERLTGGEAGATVSTLDARVALRGTFFWTELAPPVANVTLSTSPALITRQRQNLGRTRSRGFELEAEAHVTEGLRVSAGYSLTDATVKRFPVNTALEGLRIPQVPRSTFSFQASYTGARVYTVALQGRASGPQFDDDQNRFRLGSYFTLDALAARRLTRRSEIFVAVENLFNTRYDAGRTPIRTTGPPLLFRVGLRLRTNTR